MRNRPINWIRIRVRWADRPFLQPSIHPSISLSRSISLSPSVSLTHKLLLSLSPHPSLSLLVNVFFLSYCSLMVVSLFIPTLVSFLFPSTFNCFAVFVFFFIITISLPPLSIFHFLSLSLLSPLSFSNDKCLLSILLFFKVCISRFQRWLYSYLPH